MTSSRCIIGLGLTGLSVARYCMREQLDFAVVDSREQPPGLDELTQMAAASDVRLGPFDADYLSQFDELIISPGVSRAEPAIQQCIERGQSVVGDIELFARHVQAPVIGITGTNGKSTVTALTGECFIAAGFNTLVGGNIGTPALDLLAEPTPDYYVIELSSYQLESCPSLRLAVGALLNITPDHLDRYVDYNAYINAKRNIIKYSDFYVYNADDSNTCPEKNKSSISFTKNNPKSGSFGLIDNGNEILLAYGAENLLKSKELKCQGMHNWTNVLAAMAIGHALQCSMASMVSAATGFTGLAHRCQFIRRFNGVTWINDSKGTNVGACIAALQGIGVGMLGKIILIAGGQAKDADFTELYEPVKDYVRRLVLFGEDAHLIEASLGEVVPITRVESMDAAVEAANAFAQPGDVVLLSPACASFDRYANFMRRGDDFKRCVEAL